MLSTSGGEMVRLKDAEYNLSLWMSAALDDPMVCNSMKKAINDWFIATSRRDGTSLVGRKAIVVDDYPCSSSLESGDAVVIKEVFIRSYENTLSIAVSYPDSSTLWYVFFDQVRILPEES